MGKRSKIFLVISCFILLISIFLLVYFSNIWKNETFVDIVQIIINIVGDAIVVGLVTHISTKSISTFISKKEFERSNKINITINKKRNSMINYQQFMNEYANVDVFWALEDSDRELLEKIYRLYDFLLKTFPCTDVEKQLLDNILNIPFVFDYYEDENIVECYNDILENFDKEKQFGNLSLIKKILKENVLKDIERFSKIIINLKKHEIINLNNVEGCQLLVTTDNIVACKIACLPNNKYTLFSYYDKEHYMNFLAFSFDYDSKEYATNILGMKYSNDDDKFKPANINLNDFIEVK